MPRVKGIAFAVMAFLLAGRAIAGDSPCPATEPRALKLPVASKLLADGKPIVIVAFGSSSTEGTGATNPDLAYPKQLERMLRIALPKSSVTVLNRGIGGQTIDAMLDRIERDILSVQPAAVVWQAGANDAMGKADPTHFSALLESGVRRIVSSGIDVVLMDNQMAPRIIRADPESHYELPMIRAARAPHVSLFSRMGLMREWHEVDPTSYDMIGPDELHHTDRGYACLAEALNRAIVRAIDPPQAMKVFTSQK
jgi:lysophospholipase L1-like esterase